MLDGVPCTPGVERALLAATRSGRAATKLGNIDLLFGLLAEPECRAALMLAARGINLVTVQRRWPQLTAAEEMQTAVSPLDQHPPGPQVEQPSDASEVPSESHLAKLDFEIEVRSTIATARSLTSDYTPDGQLATEHLLLGLLHAGDEVSRWLCQQGLDPVEVEHEVQHLYGHTPGPLPLDDESDASLDETLPTEPAPAEAHSPGAPITTFPAQPIAEDPNHILPPNADHAAAAGQVGVLRILDAAANRAREGLRVIEDYARFALDDRLLCGECKYMRHELTAALVQLPLEQLIAARETIRDIGTGISTTAEQSRGTPRQVVQASLKRLQEALRSLEEYGKLFSPQLGGRLEQLRYRSYTLERVFVIGETSRERLSHAQLYVLIPGLTDQTRFAETVTQLISAGVDVLQLRDKQLPDHLLLQRARLLRELTRETSTLCIINDRPDLARLAEADGVHLGQDELSVKDARTIVGPETLVGVSTHSLIQARQAVSDGANYIGVGPTFPSGTKQFAEFTGTELLAAIAEEIRLPAFAIGGITEENLSQVFAAGIRRVAVSGAVLNAARPANTAHQLKQLLKRG